MTEKRFEFQNQDYHLNMVYDNEKGGVIFNEDIVDCLNALHEENKHLNNIISAIEKGSCRSIDSFLDAYCTDEILKEFDLE